MFWYRTICVMPMIEGGRNWASDEEIAMTNVRNKMLAIDLNMLTNFLDALLRRLGLLLSNI